MPGCLPGTRSMVYASQSPYDLAQGARFSITIPHHRQRHRRQIPAPRRSAVLVSHHPKHLTLPRQLQNRQQKILPPSPIHPTRSKDQMRSTSLRQRQLTRQLTRPIHTHRSQSHPSRHRPSPRTIEYIVGRKVDHRGANPLRLFPNRPHRILVDRVRQLRLTLSLINRSIRCRIHNPSRTNRPNRLAKRTKITRNIRQVHLLMRRSNHLSQRSQRLQQLTPNLSGRTRQ